MEYVTGREAQILLKITTRQQLYNIVKENNITIKSNGVGKPNFYLKKDIEKYIKRPKARTVKQAVKKAKVIKKKKETRKVNKENLAPPVEPPPEPMQPYKRLDDENFSPLNKIGQDEFIRIEKALRENGTYEDKDRSLLLFYAISYQKYINAVVKSEQEDDLVSNEVGDLKIHPYFLIADKCFKHMNDMAKQLGIGVRSRVGLEIKKEKKVSVFDMMNKDEEF